MENEARDSSLGISSMEMLSFGGFSLFFGWMFIVFFWLFCDFPQGVQVAVRDLVQLFVFAAVPLGYLALHFLAKNPRFNVFSRAWKAGEVVCAVVLPAVALAMYLGVEVPLALVCLANFLVGLAAASIQLSWLDVCSRIKSGQYSRFTGLSLFAGGLLFVLVALSPSSVQPVFGIIYIVLSCVLLSYSSNHADRNDEKAPLESIADTWRFTKEIEPSFLMFGVVFGITFVFLFNKGSEPVLLGLIFTLVGSLAVSILSIVDKQMSITVYQRILVVITVVACVLVPLVDQPGQVALSCVVTASWAMFVAINYGYLVKKCVVAWEAPLFRQVPIRLAIPALGFAVGWALASCITSQFGADSDAFMYMRFSVALLLVAAVMVFLPSSAHHPVDGSSPTGERVTTTVVTVDTSESELLAQRCAAVAKLFGLSPRETEIMGYLVRGRNAAYIQEELTISPHTVKSHIYNIYRKLDIHSQQKLMDFVEAFPLD